MTNGKHMRSLPALLLSVLLLAGCGPRTERSIGQSPTPAPTPEPLTAASLLREVGENLTERHSTAAEVQGSMTYTALSKYGEREIHADLSLTGESTLSPLAIHAAGTAGMAVLGVDMDVPVELYALEEEDAAVIYLNVLGAWTRTAVPRAPLTSVDPSSLAISDKVLQAVTLSEDTETVGERACHRLELTVTGEMLAEASADLALTAPESGPTLSATLWVDAETRLPVRLALGLKEPLVTPTLTVRELEMLITYTGFDTVESITPPPAALSAPAAAA